MKPMPSPRGTNFAGLFLDDVPGAAYDAAPEQMGDVLNALHEFLQSRLTASEMTKAKELLAALIPETGADDEQGEMRSKLAQSGLSKDDVDRVIDLISPRSASDRDGATSLTRFAQDSRGRSFNERFPDAARIGTNPFR